jgi:hypothetical protein
MMGGAKPYNVIQGHPIPGGDSSSSKLAEEIALLRAEVMAMREAVAELVGMMRKERGTAAA